LQGIQHLIDTGKLSDTIAFPYCKALGGIMDIGVYVGEPMTLTNASFTYLDAVTKYVNIKCPAGFGQAEMNRVRRELEGLAGVRGLHIAVLLSKFSLADFCFLRRSREKLIGTGSIVKHGNHLGIVHLPCIFHNHDGSRELASKVMHLDGTFKSYANSKLTVVFDASPPKFPAHQIEHWHVPDEAEWDFKTNTCYVSDLHLRASLQAAALPIHEQRNANINEYCSWLASQCRKYTKQMMTFAGEDEAVQPDASVEVAGLLLS